MSKLEKEYQEYLQAEYEKYKASQAEIPSEEIVAPVADAAPKARKSFKEDIGVTREDLDQASQTWSDVLTTLPQGVTTWSDEIMANLGAGVQKAAGSKIPFSDLVSSNEQTIRQGIAEARARSPIATAVGETATGIGTAFVPGLGAGKLAGAGSMVARGMFEGLGTAQDKTSWEGATQAGIGGALAAGGALVGGGLKKLTTGNADKARANILGARTSEFKEIGIKERKRIAKNLKDMGLFSTQKVDFDVNAGKFVPRGKSLENLEKPVREKLLERLEDASSKIQEEKIKSIGKFLNNPVPLAEIEDELNKVVRSYGGKATGMPERRAAAEAVKQKILVDIEEDYLADGLEDATVGLIERAKNRLSEDVKNYGKNPLLQKVTDEAQIYQNMYSAINRKLREKLADTKYAKFNEMQQNMLTASADLYKAIAADDAQVAQAGWGGWFNKIANETLGSPEAGLGMANVSEALSKVPGTVNAVRTTVSEAPFQVQRSWMDTSMPTVDANTLKTRSETAQPSPTGYKFQNVKPAFPMRRPQSIDPMEVAKMKLPRTTKGLIENKEAVISKLLVSGVPEEMVESVTIALNEDPEAVGSVASLVAMQFPTIFEKSKYKMFDGKILDPNERARAADETSKRDDLTSLQKAKIINELNKTGKWLGE